MIDGSTWFVPEDIFNTFNVPETPQSVISSYIRGSSGPLLKVYETEDMAGKSVYVNANFIMQVDVQYD